jgi:hypothetical protein
MVLSSCYYNPDTPENFNPLLVSASAAARLGNGSFPFDQPFGPFLAAAALHVAEFQSHGAPLKYRLRMQVLPADRPAVLDDMHLPAAAHIAGNPEVAG